MYQRIWFMGDVHGSYIPIENFWRRNKDKIDFSKENDCLILLGDSGLLYYQDYRDKNFKKKISKYPFTFFVIKGNHDQRSSVCAANNPDEWEQIYFFNGSTLREKKYSNIIYAMDYPCIYTINNCLTLVIPGAYSVDKYYRIKRGWNWFENEQLTKEEMDLGKQLIKAIPTVDLVLSHTCPICYEPTDLFLSTIDQSTVDKTMERYLGEIEYNLNYQYWLWGHYHTFRRYPVTKDGKQRIMLSAGQEAINLEDIINNIRKIY